MAFTGPAGGLLTTSAVTAQEAEEAAAVPATLGRELSIGLYLVDLIQIEGAQQSFSADVILRLQWHDPELAGVYERPRTLDFSQLWMPRLQIVNQLSVAQNMAETAEVWPDGTVRYVQRYTGRFSALMDLRDFPLDHQSFNVFVISPPRQGETYSVTVDPDMVRLANDGLSISDWRVDDVRIEEAEFSAGPLDREYPGVRLSIEATRIVQYYVIQVLIPLIAIVLMGWTVFWIAPSVIPTRVGVVVTTMLTLFAYRFMVADHVPRLSYLTRFDYFILGATVIVMLGLLTMAGTAYLWGREQEDAVRRIDRIGRALYPLAFAVYSAIVWLG